MKILVVIGTRPEAIKMAPLISRMKNSPVLEVKLCNTGQHKDLLDPILDFFQLEADFNLHTMLPGQGLHELTAAIILKTKQVFENYRPDYILVHGDTTTSFAASLSAFYAGIKVAHIEAGLRTYNKLAPFPEEINRTLTARLTDVHFAPTARAAENLEKEGIGSGIQVTGNTVIDALFDAVKLVNEDEQDIIKLKKMIGTDKKVILFTGHRRENFGHGFEAIFSALHDIAAEREDVLIIYPVHPNPQVKLVAEKYFRSSDRICLIDPLSYGPFVWLMQQSYIILTDSGGIQEEAPSLGKPVLVLRDVTERPEAVDAGTVIIVGTDAAKIRLYTSRLLDDPSFYRQMAEIINPYGDGHAAERIVRYFENIVKQ